MSDSTAQQWWILLKDIPKSELLKLSDLINEQCKPVLSLTSEDYNKQRAKTEDEIKEQRFIELHQRRNQKYFNKQ